MPSESVIPYDLVATKMNFWYSRIKNNDIGNAEKVRREIQQEINQMEENQDVLIYYSLLEFRHKLMLAYIYPNAVKDIKEIYGDIRGYIGNRELNGMLEYYYYFFTGEYHFRQKELTHSLTYYRKAEKCLDTIDRDNIELEKAEFYFNLSEIFYHMKQTHFSMNYAMHAYDIFKNQPEVDGSATYGVQKVRCQFIIFGNLADCYQYDKALKQAHEAYNEAKRLHGKEKNREHLLRSSLFNIGLCYNNMEELDESVSHLFKALEITKPENHDFMARTLFLIAYIKGKQKDFTEAETFYRRSRELAEKYKNDVILAKLKMVKGLFLSEDLGLVREAFKIFESKDMYPDMEHYGESIADILVNKKDAWGATDFYRLAIEAKRQIERGV
ncbi:Rap family tetratricopeptide repeat protein [Bacillus swezeyi]|uniref:Tetratricopeptide repeat protein n=1 Tax=Bacillus swezeyi TaxID=1925020 RepID=A0A5M8RDP9_9BACI|nr:Rap family tetratricopeptide repeat protein [Bacillus swezeyi]KAA6446737.1 tetratricopeptide repeat protein [Bacillus swezeyi]KAA6476633.1 tetratricopeptide repeat protein [Bacillus swezeyi]